MFTQRISTTLNSNGNKPHMELMSIIANIPTDDQF